MSFLIEKAKANLNAANSLRFDPPSHCSSIHCSYYSCLQLLIHIVKVIVGKSDSEMWREIRSREMKGGTHAYYKKIAIERISIDRREIISDVNRISELQSLRNQADYENLEITIEKSSNAYSIAKDVHRILLNYILTTS
ncbi:hypothetical protein [Candidatus Pollutiaquabacter sp.]|uniref:hypothetical protein n=1 Tax=Candidatus Pollutiaquabacter sp. TaxID=3416354 RepID=UPI003CB3E589|nr:hypothetical protein [Bacteroidota bacterium]